VLTQLKDINSGVPQSNVLGPVLYLLYIADLPVALDTIIATYAADITILAAHKDHVEASHLQERLFYIQIWLKKWRIKVNGAKSVQVIFTTRRKTCPPIILNGLRIPQAEDARYLGLHLDRRLNWRKHIFTKRKQLGIQLSKMYWCFSAASHSCRSKVNCCCTKQSLNQYGLMFNFGAQPPIQT